LLALAELTPTLIRYPLNVSQGVGTGACLIPHNAVLIAWVVAISVVEALSNLQEDSHVVSQGLGDAVSSWSMLEKDLDDMLAEEMNRYLLDESLKEPLRVPL
jgi:hypothetical protein